MTFTTDVYDQIRAGCIRSASRVVPAVFDLLYPHTVIDFGCGEGHFAKAFAKLGCEVIALDSSVESKHEKDGVIFCHRDLETAPALISPDSGPYDLAICLEVAEHLSQAGGDRLVESLVNNGRMVLWSAAIPGQSGHRHINCQWPDYWDKKFAERGYRCCDTLRWMFWDDDQVEPWYRQNMLLYAAADCGRELAFEMPRHVVHPGIWAWKQ